MHQASAERLPVPFGLEIHSNDPASLAKFYADLLNISFVCTTYPFTRYLAQLGNFALIITECSGPESSHSEPGRVSLLLISPQGNTKPAQPYFLYPLRPLAGFYPARFAERVQDPEGHYVAQVPLLEYARLPTPMVSNWGGLAACIRDFAHRCSFQLRTRTRHRWSLVHDACIYAADSVSIVNRELEGYTHIVASQQGLFVVNKSSYKQVLRGWFFGLTVREGDVYCFQQCADNGAKGRIVRLIVRGKRILSAEIVVKDLDVGCHQIDFIGDTLFIADCANCRILALPPGAKQCDAYYPLGHLNRDEAWEYHLNSITAHPDGTMWLLLHNYARKPSEILIVNSKFEQKRRFPLTAGSAHNIVLTNDELEYLVVDSYGGRILSARGPVVEGLSMVPRGLSLDDKLCVFGESLFATRFMRRYVPGRVHFVNRSSWETVSSIELPASPTEIRRIDGQDYSISNYARRRD